MSNLNSDLRSTLSNYQDATLVKPVKVMAITAGKGGVGKSNVALNLAIGLAQRNNKVMLLDADLGLGNQNILLGMEAKYNLSHVIKGMCSLSDIVLHGPNGIRVIPAASGADYMTQLSAAELAGIIDSFNELSDDLDYMIIDTASGISDTVLSFARSSQEIIVMVCDEPTSLADAWALIKVMRRRYECTHFHILVNMVRHLKDGRELFNKLLRLSEQFLDIHLDYAGAIPFDEHLHQSVKKRQPVLVAFPESEVAEAFRELSELVISWPNKSHLVGNTSFFLERLVSGEF